MYLLIDEDNDVLITAYHKEELEEIALSMFEEDIIEWFNLHMNSGYIAPEHIPITIRYSIENAISNFSAKIIELPDTIDSKGSIY